MKTKKGRKEKRKTGPAKSLLYRIALETNKTKRTIEKRKNQMDHPTLSVRRIDCWYMVSLFFWTKDDDRFDQLTKKKKLKKRVS